MAHLLGYIESYYYDDFVSSSPDKMLAAVDRLVLLKELIKAYPLYEVCFLPESAFEKITMQLACWGDRATIGWIAGGKSTACKDYTNVNALIGFCGFVVEAFQEWALVCLSLKWSG